MEDSSSPGQEEAEDNFPMPSSIDGSIQSDWMEDGSIDSLSTLSIVNKPPEPPKLRTKFGPNVNAYGNKAWAKAHLDWDYSTSGQQKTGFSSCQYRCFPFQLSEMRKGLVTVAPTKELTPVVYLTRSQVAVLLAGAESKNADKIEEEKEGWDGILHEVLQSVKEKKKSKEQQAPGSLLGNEKLTFNAKNTWRKMFQKEKSEHIMQSIARSTNYFDQQYDESANADIL